MTGTTGAGWLAIPALLFLTACGGGGGSSSNGLSLSLSPSSLAVPMSQGYSQPFSFTGTVAGTYSGAHLYVVLFDPQYVTDQTTFNLAPTSNTQFSVGLATNSELPLGSHTGAFTVQFYSDYVNNQFVGPLLGQPPSLPYAITVNPVHSVHKLLPDVVGVALSQTPGWSRLTRTLPIVDNLGEATAWQASSDHSWLTVTTSGTTGTGGLTLTADASTLTADAASTATVTLTSTDPTVAAIAPIKVSVWKGSTTPVASAVAGSYTHAAADPVNPYVYLNDSGGTIDVFNVYTQAKVTTLTAAANPPLGAMAVSSNGSTLYVLDVYTVRILAIDTASGTLVRSWAPMEELSTHETLTVARPNGVDVLLLGDGAAYVADTGASLGTSTGIGGNINASVAATHDGHSVYTQDTGMSPATVTRLRMDLNDSGQLLTQNLGSTSALSSSNGQAIAVSGDGSGLYTASGSPYDILSLDPLSLALIADLPGGSAYPSNVAVAWDGRVFAGTGFSYVSDQMLVYSSSGALLSTYPTPSQVAGQMVVTGDGIIGVVPTNGGAGGAVYFVPAAPPS